MTRFFDRPFICSKKSYLKGGVPEAALSFLKVNKVPSEWHSGWNALLNFFSFRKSNKVEDFQSLVNIICYRQGPGEKTELTKILNSILDANLSVGTIEKQLNPLLTILVNHLSIKGVISLPPVPIFSGTRSEKILNTEWMDKLPAEVKFWYIAPDRKRLVRHAESLNHQYVSAVTRWYEQNSDHKQISSSAALMKHFYAFMAEDSFQFDRFITMMRVLFTLSKTSRSVLPALHVYSEVNNQPLQDLYSSRIGGEEFRLSDVHRVYHPDIIDSRKQSGLPDPYNFSHSAKRLGLSSPTLKGSPDASKNGAFAWQLPHSVSTDYGLASFKNWLAAPEGYTAYELMEKTDVQIGAYSISERGLKTFNPKHFNEKYPDSLWLAYQKDWFDEKRGEKTTEKSMAGALRHFNAYIFSYLPWFQEHVNPSLGIPSKVEDFDPNIFVRRTHSFLLRHDSKVVLPITLPEFVDKTADLGAKGGSASPNSLKAKQNLLIDYFQSICVLEGIEFNPLNQMTKIRGYSYAEAQKTKLDYDYWWLLKEFVKEFAWCSTLAYRDIIGSGDTNKASWVKAFRRHASERTVKFGNTELDFANLNNLDSHNHTTIHVFSTLLCLLSQCGLRFSNAFWLDARNFDSRAPEQAKDDAFVEIFINTDKARLKPFASHVTFNVLRLLRTLNQVRGRCFTDETVPYQGNTKSKWKEIVPLFRSSESRHDESDDQKLNDAITLLTVQFEDLLRRTGKEFDGYIYPKVRGISYDDYVYYKASRSQTPVKTFLLERESYYDGSDQLPRPVTLFEYRSAITSHGLRKTFDSFYTNFISNKDVGDLFTGQTPNTVGYYSSNTVEERSVAKSVAEQAGLPFRLSKKGKNEKDLIQNIKENGVPPEIIAISTASGDDFNLDEEYRQAPDNNIAVNRTHICPYANVCPRKIRAILDNQKLCGLCPAALSFPSDAPAIAAEIRKLGDEIADLSLAICSGELTAGEADDYRNKRMSLVPKLSAWMCRHDHLINMTDGEILLGEDGHSHYEKLTYHRPDENWTDDKRNLWRIFETADVKTLQSERLRVNARRYSRRLIRNITPNVMDQIDTDPVKVSALLVEKYARLEGLSVDEVVEALAKPNDDQTLKLMNTLVGGPDDA